MTKKDSILYVDDEKANLDGFKFAFMLDYEIWVAHSAKEGLKMLKEKNFKLVISDQKMPEVSGIDFLKIVKEKHPNTIRIILTAYADIENAIDAINKGEIYRYISKPWNKTDLKLTIDSALETYELKQENKNLIASLKVSNNVLNEKVVELEEKEEKLQTQNKEYATLNEEYRSQNEDLKNANIKTEDTRNKFISLFEHNPVSLWEEDFSELMQFLIKKKTEVNDLKLYLNNNPDFVAECASKIIVKNVNNVSLDMFGVKSKDELISDFAKAFNKNSFNTFKSLLISLSQNKTHFTKETEYIKFNGEVFPAIIQIVLTENYKNSIISITDISKQKLAEQKLQIQNKALLKAKQEIEESAKQLKSISGNFANGMIYQVAMLNENERRFNYVSETVNKLYGITVAQAKADANLIYSRIHKDDVERLVNEEKEALKNMTVFKTEVRVHNTDGSIRWAYYVSKPRIIDGLVCWDGIEVDITERKNTEEELKVITKEIANQNKELESLNFKLKQTNIELNRAKEEAEENENELKEAQRIAHIGSWTLHIESDKLSWSKEEYNLFELPYIQKLTNIDFFKLIHPDDYDQVKRAHKGLLKGKLYDISFRVVINNKIKWIYETAKLNYDKNNKPISVTGISHDITRVKEHEIVLKKQNQELSLAKEEAEESQIRFKALHNASFGGIAVHDKGLILECNLGLSELTGHSVNELVGMDGLLLLAEESREEVMKNILSGYEKPYEVIGLCKNGDNYPVRLEAREIPFKGKMVRVVEFRDITERVKKEQELISAREKAEESKRQFIALFEQAPLSIQFFNKNGLTININKAWEELWQASREDVINKYNIFDDTYADKTGWLAYFKRAFNGETVQVPDLEYNPAESGQVGRKRTLKCIVFPIVQKGIAEQVVIIHQDVTEIKKYELELIKSKEKAEESDRLKTEFLNNMSHEIRTPMNGILGFSKMLNNRNISEKKQKYFINIIQNSGYQLLRIIDDILEISRLGTKQVKAHNEEVCLNDVLLEQFSIFDLKAKENKTSLYLKKELSDIESTIQSDKSKLNKILGNLLENALKFTNEGTIEFGYKLVSAEAKAADESDKLTNKVIELQLYVKDTGIGIAANKHDVIFKRFSQEDKEISQKSGGLGLGLSIAKENAELLGGKITLKSKKGEGSTFYVNIPYNKIHQNAKISKSDKYILIVEDEEVNLLFLQALLEDEIKVKHRILHAKNGLEAINMCKENMDIILVLMDLKMPVMNGYEASRQIKLFRPKLKIIAQTAYSTKADKQKALDAGCDDFISKPISEEVLSLLVNKYLN